jgi:hypothetical protein
LRLVHITSEAQQRVHPASESIEDLAPGPAYESLANPAGCAQVVDVDEGVVVAHIADALLAQLPGEPFPSVDVDLNLEGEPALKSHVHEAQLGVDQVEIEVEALSQARRDSSADQAKAGGDLESGEDADQAFGHLVPLGNLASQLVLAPHDAALIDEGTPRLAGDLAGVEPYSLAGRIHVAAEVIEDRHALPQEKARKPAGVPEGPQMPVHDQPVHSRERPHDLLSMNVLETAAHRPSKPYEAISLPQFLRFGCGRRPR